MHPIMSRPRNRRRAVEEQLWLPLALLSEEDIARNLRNRGADVRRVRFKENRTRLISLSRDHGVVNIHACFRSASDDVLDAIAAFVRAPAGSTEIRDAIRRMRAWWDGQVVAPDEATRALEPPPCCATDEQRSFLRELYDRFNIERFDGRLPREIPIRLSSRMTRRFGHVHYGRARAARSVEEIALNADLMMRGNERHLIDTLLHEMAHIEAWLVHAHREHGPTWRAIARRVGCEARACSRARMRRRSRKSTPATAVPVIL
jgi:hypothetical protein